MFINLLKFKQKLYEQIRPYSLLKGNWNFNRVEARIIFNKVRYLRELYSALQIFFCQFCVEENMKMGWAWGTFLDCDSHGNYI